ncbi:hypothetical protein [Spongiactinospora sp. TRM90649]|uniref:hypothetical protein n=1 Tax=Spongiactinospora sp. TRM90649 TaxID=3031114 RepID=UPI0023F8397F|nr:hypothetical protein [Spongiactinospora sp. TRM90649]MDF5753160.1 hypothetical protein [Spongiactinospora sp. TRM90649]
MNETVQETRIGHVTTAFGHDTAEFRRAVSASNMPLRMTDVAPNDRCITALPDKPESAAAGETELDEPSGDRRRCLIRARDVPARPRLVFLR